MFYTKEKRVKPFLYKKKTWFVVICFELQYFTKIQVFTTISLF